MGEAMLQFYFLSILLNLIAGLILVYATDFTRAQKSQNDGAEDFSAQDGTGSGETQDKEDVGDESAGAKEDDSLFDRRLNFAINAKGSFFDDMTFRLIAAILSGLVGIMKLLSPIQNDVPVIGDLIPALAGLGACFALLVEYYSQKTNLSFKMPAVLETVFVGGRKYLGVFCILAGILHFIFPRVLFL